MKTVVFLLMIFMTVMVMAGCGGVRGVNSSGEATPGELELLGIDRVYFDTDKEALAQLRAGTGYIEDKYKGVDFTVWLFSASDAFNPEGRLWMKGPNGEEFMVYVEPKDGYYECSENYYGFVIEDNYDDRMESRLSWNGVDAVVYTKFFEAINEEITAEDLIKGRSRRDISRVTKIYVKESGDFESLAKKCEQIIKSYNIYGSYTVMEVPDSWSKNGFGDDWMRSSLSGQVFDARYGFNCFDVDNDGVEEEG